MKCAAVAQTVASNALATALAIGGRDEVQETIMWIVLLSRPLLGHH